MNKERSNPLQWTLGECLRQDFKLLTRTRKSRLAKWGFAFINRGMQVVFLYRVSHKMWQAGIPLVSAVLSRLAQHLYSVDIDYHARLGPGIVIFHGFGIVIGCEVVMEGNCWLFHGVTFGDRGTEWIGSDALDGHPWIGKGCMFGAGAKILGPLTIGNNSVIGANAVVLKDVPPNSIVAGIPGRVVGTRPPMDENLRRLDLAEVGAEAGVENGG